MVPDALPGIDDPLDVIERQSHRHSTGDMLARIERGHDVIGVVVETCDDVNRIDLRRAEYLIQRFICAVDVEGLGDSLTDR